MTNTIQSSIAQLFRLLTPYLKEHKLAIFIITVGILLQIAVTAILPVSYKYFFDEVARHVLHPWLILGLICLIIVVFLYGTWTDLVLAKVGTKVCNAMQFNIQRTIDNMPFDYFKNATITSKTITNFSIHIRNISTILIRTLPQFITTSLQIIISYLVMFFFSPALTLFMLILIPLVIFSSSALLPLTKKAEQQKSKVEITLINHIRESIFMHPIVSAFQLESFWQEQFKEKMLEYIKKERKVKFLTLLSERIFSSSFNLLELIIVVIGVITVIQDKITIGAFIGFFVLAQIIIRSFLKLSNIYSFLPEAFNTIEQLTDFFIETAKLQPSNGDIILRPFNDKIRFENVSFAYTKNAPILKDINFTIHSGESIALVGSSGSGKSTLLSLLLNFYAPTKGTITIDGHNLQSIDTPSFRQQVAIIMQDSHLFDMTIRDNIRMGKLTASDEEIIAAAKAAELHETISSFPQGYDTPLIDQGSNLSGGQRQRIAIARAFLRNPHILFGDEITAALDPVTELAINDTLMQLAKQCTYICVTHHLKNVINMDRIFVVDHGRIVESGNHQELLALKGIYHQLWTKQNSVSVSADGQNAQVSLELLHKIPLFNTLDNNILAMLADQLVMESYEKNQLIFKQGSKGDKFYIIVRGIVEIKKLNSAGIEEQVATLETGDHFGEIALIKDVPRNASVYTIEPCIFLTLSRQKFLHIFNQSPTLRAELEKIMQLRI